jgi:hypothetical protein
MGWGLTDLSTSMPDLVSSHLQQALAIDAPLEFIRKSNETLLFFGEENKNFKVLDPLRHQR